MLASALLLAVLTAADMEAAGVGNVGRHPPLAGRGGSKLVIPHRPALARERVLLAVHDRRRARDAPRGGGLVAPPQAKCRRNL